MSTQTTTRPLRADAARNRARILQAAREVFASRGLEVTLDDIARHAGLGTGTVYRRFADREALVDALFEERVASTVALAGRCLAEPDPWRGFVALVETTCEQLAVDKGLRQVMLSSSYGLDRVALARNQIYPLVTRLIRRGQAAGVLRADLGAADVPVLFLMIGTVADFGGDVAPGLWRRYLAFILDGMRARDGQPLMICEPMCPEQLDTAMSCYQPANRRPAARAESVERAEGEGFEPSRSLHP